MACCHRWDSALIFAVAAGSNDRPGSARGVRVIGAAYEKRSVALTSNLHPGGFDTIMPKSLAIAAVNRFLHHAHMVLTDGSSLRLAEATAGKGVKQRARAKRYGGQLPAHLDFC